MARVKLELPQSLPFSTEMAVRISDLNYGGHVGNDRMLSLLHEARARFLAHHGWKESDVAGTGIIMTDAAIVYKAEAFYGQMLRIEVGVADLGRVGCDLVYRVRNAATGQTVAEAKTGIVFFDYQTRTVQRTPAPFAALFGAKRAGEKG